MEVNNAYNIWADQYDTNENKTRDLEARSLREMVGAIPVGRCLEIGCGTGKNTVWLVDQVESLKAVDFSEEMLARAKAKVQSPKVEFIQADILQDWSFAQDHEFDLVTFSLVLEHIEDLDVVFRQLERVVRKHGHVYIGELHPFKQYAGSKARFETEEGVQVVSCFNHHVSDFTNAAKAHGFDILRVSEYFDDPERTSVPRILALLLGRC